MSASSHEEQTLTPRTDPVIVQLNCEANPSTDTVKIDRADWNGMTPAERAVSIQNMVDEHISSSGGGGWHIADPDDEAAVGHTPTPVDVEQVMRLVQSYAIAFRYKTVDEAAALLTDIRMALDGTKAPATPPSTEAAADLDEYIELVVAATRHLHRPGGTERFMIEIQAQSALRSAGQPYDKSLFARALTVAVDTGKLRYLGGEDRGDILYQATEGPR